LRRSREQNATQNLIDVIRGDRPEIPENTGSKEPLSRQKGKAFSFGFPGKAMSLGVFISQTHIALALTTDKGAAHEKGLVQWQTIPVPEDQSIGTRHFSGILKRCITQFAGGKKKVAVWCALDSAHLKLKQLTIPDLPESKIATAAFWGLKKESGFNENMEILDFEILDEFKVDGIKKKQILAYSVPKSEVEKLKSTFSKAGFPLKGITAIPFAMQNLVRMGQISSEHDYFAIVNINRDNSEVFCFSKKGILLVRSLRTGTLNLVEELDVLDDADPIDILSAMDNPDTKAYPGMQEPAERLISKIVRTGDYCAQNFTGNIPLKQYIFFGHTDQCTPFMNQVEAMIPAQVTILKPSQESLSKGMEAELLKNVEQRNQILTAFSIALSDNKTTPNFLYTFSDRRKTAQERKITLATVALGLLLMAGAGGGYFYLIASIAKGRATLSTIRQEQTRFGQVASEASISKAIDLAQIRGRVTLNYVQSYLPLAVISEICRHTPDNIKLISLSYTREPGKEKSDPENKQLTLKGRVTAHPYSLDVSLGNYSLTLSESPMFGDIDIQDRKASGQSISGDKAVLTFTAILEVI